MRRGVVPRRSQVWCGHQLALVTRPTWNLRRCLVLVARASMPACPHCQQVVVTRDGHDRHGRQRFACAHCGRDFTLRSASAFSGYRWPADVILMAVRWYLRHPLSATSVLELLAERGIDVSNRTVLRWVQTFGPQLAAEARKHRRPLGSRWYADEMLFFRGRDQWYLYRVVDEHGQVVDVLLRDHRDTASAEAFFEQALGRSGQAPSAIITDHHQPYVKAIRRSVPTAVHIRSGLHRATGGDDQADRAKSCVNNGSLARVAWVENAAHGSALPGRLRMSARPAWWAHPLGRPVAGVLRLGQPARSRANRGPCRARAGMRLNRNPRARRR